MSKLWLFWLLTFSYLLVQGGWDGGVDEGGIQTKAVLLLQGLLQHQKVCFLEPLNQQQEHREPRGAWPLPPTHLLSVTRHWGQLGNKQPEVCYTCLCEFAPTFELWFKCRCLVLLQK